MIFPESGWTKYIRVLSAIDKTAARKFTAFLDNTDISTQDGRKAAIDYAYALATKYGEMAAAGACEMYDAVAEASGVVLAAAVPAETATYGEVAKTVNGMAKQNQSNEAMGNGVGRLVKRAGADTTLKNALRDGAEFAWVPHGDTCSFCIMLASNGWQKASKKTIRGDHAEHIHANCDCTFAIRFDGKSRVGGYDPDKYREIYEAAEGDTWQEKLNSMRREQHAKEPEKDNARKREAYEKKKKATGAPFDRKTKLMTEREDLAAVNPNYGQGAEYSENCQRCVVAYEMRRQGYNVKAKPAVVTPTGKLSRNDPTIKTGLWDKGFKGMVWSPRGATQDRIEQAMATWGDGARAEVYVAWKTGGAHVFIAEQRNGKTVFLDPQKGIENCEEYFTRAAKSYTMFARIDGKAPCDDIGIFVENAR